MDPIFTEDFIRSIPRDNTLAVKRVCDEYLQFVEIYSSVSGDFIVDHSEQLHEAYAFLQIFDQARNLNLGIQVDLPENSPEAVGWGRIFPGCPRIVILNPQPLSF